MSAENVAAPTAAGAHFETQHDNTSATSIRRPSSIFTRELAGSAADMPGARSL